MRSTHPKCYACEGTGVILLVVHSADGKLVIDTTELCYVPNCAARASREFFQLVHDEKRNDA